MKATLFRAAFSFRVAFPHAMAIAQAVATGAIGLRSTLISNEAHKHREEKYPHLPEWFSTWPNGAGSG